MREMHSQMLTEAFLQSAVTLASPPSSLSATLSEEEEEEEE